MKRTLKEIQTKSTAKALRRARESMTLSRKDLALRLEITDKAIEKFENGRFQISDSKLDKILGAIGITKDDLLKLKRGKKLKTNTKREKRVLENSQRRSYQKRISKECAVLRSMRLSQKLTQYKASELCGYAKASIGHIENGRIELNKKRIEHIVNSYGLSFRDFELNMKKEDIRSEVVDYCLDKISSLPDEKLDIVKNLLGSL